MLRCAVLSLSLLACLAAPAPLAAQECVPSFVVENESDVAIIRFYLRRASSGPWGRDQLGSNAIASGDFAEFQPSPGGHYDLRAVSRDGRALEARRVDLCSIMTVVVSGRSMVAR